MFIRSGTVDIYIIFLTNADLLESVQDEKELSVDANNANLTCTWKKLVLH